MKYFLSILSLIVVHSTYAQDNNKSLSFTPYINDVRLLVDSENLEINKDDLNIDVLRFYISSVSLYNNEEQVFNDETFHLVDVTNPNSLSWSLLSSNKEFF